MEWGWLRQTLEECGPFPWLSSEAGCPIRVRAVDPDSLGKFPTLPWGCCHHHSRVCSMKDNGIEGINPRAGFGSPDGEYSLVDVKGTGKDTVPWSPLPFLWEKLCSVVVQCIASSSMGIYLSLAEGWAQAGSSSIFLPHTLPLPDSHRLAGAVPRGTAPHERALPHP